MPFTVRLNDETVELSTVFVLYFCIATTDTWSIVHIHPKSYFNEKAATVHIAWYVCGYDRLLFVSDSITVTPGQRLQFGLVWKEYAIGGTCKGIQTYSTPTETHLLYVFTVVNKFNLQELCYLMIYCPEILYADF